MRENSESRSRLLREVARLRRRIAELEEHADELREREIRYLTVLETADDAIFIKDAEGRYVVVNPVLARRLGRSRENLIGKIPTDIYPEPIGSKIRADDLETLQGGKMVENEEGIMTPEGPRVFLARKVPIKESEGRVVGLLGISRDITGRKKLEEALLAHTEDLEQFAYVASHDLQEPLRMVSSFVQLLARRYQGALDKEADEFIDFAVDGAKRMQRLINDLLEYSRVGTQGRPPEVTDCEDILAQVTTNLKSSIEETEATITHDSLPTVMADPTQLSQLFQNLIGNAVKFCGDRKPRVHVCATDEDGEWVFSVRDNGIGIDKEHADRVFAIFQRLHGRGKYPGTGIGLAICKKIVERHGGRIWLDSEECRGSTFYFTIPGSFLDNRPYV